MDLKEEDILGDKLPEHWYYVAKSRALKDFIGNISVDHVFDVGAGSGFFSRYLLDQNRANSATCIDPFYGDEKEELHNQKPIAFKKSAPDKKAGLILMMDVLEHVDEDSTLAENYLPHLEEGGYILVTVPAFQFLWSGHDVFLEHKRRYTAKNLEIALRNAGLKPVKTRYFYGFLFPLLALIRLVSRFKKQAPKSDMKPCAPWLNRLLIYIHHIERRTLFPLNKLCGLTVFCLCRKQNDL